MTNENHNHDPHHVTADFRDALEQQVAGALRRANRWHDRRAARPRTRPMMLALMCVLAATLGSLGTYAAVTIDQRREAEIVVGLAEIRLETARRRTEIVETRFRESRAMAEAGVVGQTELMHDERALQAERADVRRRELDLAEVLLTGRESDDRLSAPLAGGTDFVSERLRNDLKALRIDIDLARRRFEHSRTLHESGFVSQGEVLRDEAEVRRASYAVESVETQLDRRRAFLDGRHTALEVDLLGLRDRAVAELKATRVLEEATRTRLARMEAMVASGAASATELRAIELEVTEHESHRRITELEIELIQARLSSESR